MAVMVGPSVTKGCEPGQVRKEAAAAARSGAECGRPEPPPYFWFRQVHMVRNIPV